MQLASVQLPPLLQLLVGNLHSFYANTRIVTLGQNSQLWEPQATYKQDACEDDVSDEVGDDEEELDEGGWN